MLIPPGTLAQKSPYNLRDVAQPARTLKSNSPVEKDSRFIREKPENLLIEGNQKGILPRGSHQPIIINTANISFSEKLDSLLEYSWDTVSMSWILEDAEYYFYDALGRNYAYWNAEYQPQLETLVPDNRTEIEWDQQDLVTMQTEYSWVDTSQAWIPEYRVLMSQSPDGSRTIQTVQDYDPYQQAWIPEYTDTSVFNVNGDLLQDTEYEYNLDAEEFTPYFFEEYQYDSSFYLVQMNSYTWVYDTTEHWENNYRYRYYNDGMGRDTLSIGSYWDGYEWYDQSKTVRNYDAGGNLAFEADYQWNGEMMWWDGLWKTEYTYDPMDRVTKYVDYDWDYSKQEWYMYFMEESVWDAQENLAEETDYYYDTAGQQFVEDWKEIYEYDLSREMSEVAMPYWWSEFLEGPTWKYKITRVTAFEWSPQLMRWDSSEINVLHYSGLFENPVNDATCKAGFSWAQDEVNDLKVYFTDKSDTTVVSWYWIFGDGQTSTLQNPEHNYINPGTYRVILTTLDKSGFCSNTLVKQIRAGSLPCQASFSFTVDTLNRVLTLSNESVGSNLKYFWNFGDGSVSVQKDPVHTYAYPGSYIVTLTVAGDQNDCMDIYLATVSMGSVLCDAEFAVFVDSSNYTTFLRAKNKRLGNRYYWVLGDGTVATGANHVHPFSHPGYYSVLLTVYNKITGCVETRKENILVGNQSPGGKAAFIYSAGDDNKVSFTNQSLGEDLKYYWDFNDGDSSLVRDPVHSYVLAGYYDVCLTVTTPDGIRNTHCEKIFAGTDSKDQCLARFEYTLSDDGGQISCMDRSFGEPNRWQWTFNDDTPVESRGAEWVSAVPVYLRVHQFIQNTSNGCRDHAFALVNMGEESKLKASFGYVIDSSKTKASTYPVDFVGISLGDAGKLKWDFGDGTYDSTTINPVHHYSEPGPYYVCLTIINSATGEEDESCEWINVGATYREWNTAATVLKVYPNPFSRKTRIEINLAEDTEIDLSIYDLMGRKLWTLARESRTSGTHFYDLDAAAFEPGHYYLLLKSDTGMARKIISIIR